MKITTKDKTTVRLKHENGRLRRIVIVQVHVILVALPLHKVLGLTVASRLQTHHRWHRESRVKSKQCFKITPIDTMGPKSMTSFRDDLQVVC
jgi:hypothetical protein